jgi:ribosomal protein L22
MTPSKPGDPSEGRPAEAEKAEVEATEAKEAAAVEAAQERAGASKPEVPVGETAQPDSEIEPTEADEAVDSEIEPTEADEAVATAAAEEEDDLVTDEPAAESDERPAKEAETTPRRRRGRRRGGEPAAEEPAAATARARREPGELVTVRAQAKYVRTSARKARLVCDHIRGKSVQEARAILAHTPRAVARDWSKLLESAVANAEHNHELIGDDLVIASVTADEGPTLKRFRPRALGRATRIRKRTSHLTIQLTPKGF